MSISRHFEKLKNQKLWVNYARIWNDKRNGGRGGYTKPPINPITLKNGIINNPESWADYLTAEGNIGKTAICRDSEGNIQNPIIEGTGLVIARGLVGVDMDNVIDDNGNIAPFAAEIVERLDTYTEYSPSGHGLHLWLYCKDLLDAAKAAELKKYNEELNKGTPKEDASKRAAGAGDIGEQFALNAAGEITDENNKKYEIEIYFYKRGGRYFTMSWKPYKDVPINLTKGEELRAIIAEYTQKKNKPSSVGTQYSRSGKATKTEEKKIIESALEAISPADLDGYKEWAPVMSALCELGYSLSDAEYWSSGTFCNVPNPMNRPNSNAYRWNRGDFRLKDSNNAAGIIINTAKRFGWTPADAFDEEARAAYGRSLHTEEERRKYGQQQHEERLNNFWKKNEDGFNTWKDRKKNLQPERPQRRSEPKKVSMEDFENWKKNRKED